MTADPNNRHAGSSVTKGTAQAEPVCSRGHVVPISALFICFQNLCIPPPKALETKQQRKITHRLASRFAIFLHAQQVSPCCTVAHVALPALVPATPRT